MSVVTQQPGSNAQTLVAVHGHREWSSGLFGCFSDIGSCIKAYFCLPCTTCALATRLGECCCMPYCVPGGTIAMRARVRTIGGIQGSVCKDCLALSFCGACAICQMEREMDAMNIH